MDRRWIGFVAATMVVIAGLSVWAGAAMSEECPPEPPPLSAVLHGIVSRAEESGASGDAAAAATLLTDYLTAHPEETHPYPYYDAGYFLHQAGKSDQATAYLEKAVKLNPCFHEAWQLLAALYQTAGDMEAAAKSLEKGAALTKDPQIWYQAGVLWVEAGEPKKALAVLGRVPREQRQTADWQVAMARAHQDLKQYDKAAEAMASAHALSKDPEHQYQCAVFWLKADIPAKALPLLRQLTEGPSPDSSWLVALSEALKALQKKEETAEAMERAANLSRDPSLRFHAAWLWLDADRPKKALALLEKLADRRDPKAEWLAALANVHMILGQTREAARAMDRAVQLDPQPDYLYNAGVLWLHADQPEKALRHLLAVCQHTPPKADWFVALAHAWIGQKQVVKAATAMERAAGLSGNPDHRYQAGRMWLEARDADAALRLLLPLSRSAAPKAEWLAGLSNAWALKGNYGSAARAMEEASRISQRADHVFAAAGLWLQAEAPEKALPLLKALAERPKVEAEWLVLLSETWFRLKDATRAAQTMERAAQISGKPEHTFRAARLWIEARQPGRSRPLLEGLVRLPSPKGEWYMALSTCWLMLDDPRQAAEAMEKGVGITRKGEDYHRAGMLWLQAGDRSKGISLLETAAGKRPVEPRWLVDLAQALLDAEREADALKVLEQADLSDPGTAPAVRYQGALLWLQLHRSEKALPVLKALCASRSPALDWLVSLIRTHVETKHVPEAEAALRRLIDLYPEDIAAWRLAVWLGLQQGDYPKAAAAMAVAVRLAPADASDLKKMADLYQLAGAPVKAAATLKSGWKGQPTAADWDWLVRIYVSGHRYELALACARSAVAAEATAARWETVGNIACRLRRFQEGFEAYQRSAERGPSPDVRLKAGHAALKMDRLDEAARLFQEAMARAEKNSRTAYEAYRNLAFIKKMKGAREKDG